ncbi:MAG: hypothetical protein VX589_07190 [Myxococcota bacterium]|nr:hypothetical protein [Myxococcota bacterium]
MKTTRLIRLLCAVSALCLSFSACDPSANDGPRATGQTESAQTSSQTRRLTPPPPPPPPPRGAQSPEPPEATDDDMASPQPPTAPPNRRQMRAVNDEAAPAVATIPDTSAEPAIETQCDFEASISATGPAIVFNDPAALRTPLAFNAILSALSASAGGAGDAAAQVALINSMLATFNRTSFINSASGIRVPVQRRTTEANLDANTLIADLLPVAVFNRLDLMSDDGIDCGEHRIVYSLDPTSRLKTDARDKFTIIFEARYPNPQPDLGIAGCQPIADFWASLTTAATTPAARAELVRQFFLTGIEVNGIALPAVMNVAHFQGTLGQIRTNQFIGDDWQLREFRTDTATGGLRLIPDTVKGTVMAELFNDARSDALGITSVRADFMSDLLTNQLPRLVQPERLNLSRAEDILVSFEPAFPDRFYDFQSDSQTNSDNPAVQASDDLVAALDTALELSGFTGVTSTQVLNRIGAMSCGGCHEFSGGQNVAPGLNWPQNNPTFVHVDDDGRLSSALTDIFLPKRRSFMLDTFLCTNTPDCIDDGDCSPEEICDEGTCIVDSETGCTGDVECDDGLICIDGDCVDAPATACETDGDCTDDLICVAGDCVEAPVSGCEVDDDCADALICVAGDCVEAPVTGCGSDVDCADELVCVEGDCVEPPMTGCEADADCRDDRICESGDCVVAPTMPSSCDTPHTTIERARRLTGNHVATGTEAGSCGGTGGESVVVVTPPRTTQLCIQLTSRDVLPILHVRAGFSDEPMLGCDTLEAEIGCAIGTGPRNRAQLEITAEANTPYYLFVDANRNAGGRWMLDVRRGRCR